MRSGRTSAMLALAFLALSSFGLSAQAAEYIGEETCAGCHEEVAAGMRGDIHQRIRPFEVFDRTVGCEGCHGPGSEHADSGDAEMIRSFADAKAYESCLSCHNSKGLAQWKASTHAIEDVGCYECHSVHTEASPLDSCQNCHSEVLADFQLPSRHPVREERMDCSSCHDVHNSAESMLAGNPLRTNDACFQCHQDKEGPFVFEHEPVTEDCGICHTPHGSVVNNLLVANESGLCLQCHDMHFHSGYGAGAAHEVEIGGNEYPNPNGVESMAIAFTTSCTQCHFRHHGTDLPTQGVPSQGRGLGR